MVSIFLNVAAFATAVAIGTNQFWNNGTQLAVPFLDLTVLAPLPILMLIALLTRAPLKPRVPALRTQATDRNR
eukprot:2176605-Pleurochrysis_carterae.AAC.1